MSVSPFRLPPRARAYAHLLAARLPRRGDRAPRPSAAHLLITWKCNLRCSGCSSWTRDPSGELSAPQWEQVFAQLRSLDIVKIIGGEPFVREDLADVVGVLRRRIDPFIVQLVTNATLTERIAAFVEQQAWPGLHLRVSLDGLSDAHDRSRGVHGTFRKVMETLRVLSRLRSRKRFRLAVNFTLTDDSLEDMQPLIERCRALGVDVVPGFKVKPFLTHCDMTRDRAETVGVRDRSAALRRLQAPGHGARTGFGALERVCLTALNRKVFAKHAAGGAALRFRCRELRNLMYLSPEGDLITCGLNQTPIGNVYREGFDAVWRSGRAAAARAGVDACPGCMQGAVEIMSRLYA